MNTSTNNEPDGKTLALILLFGVIVTIIFCMLANT